MNPPNDPVTAQRPNPGSFLSASAGGQNGNGSALLQLLRLQAMGQGGQGMTAGPTNPQGIQMSQPPQGVGGPPRIMGAPPSGDVQPRPQIPSVGQSNASQGASMAQPIQQPTPEDHVATAIAALKNYIENYSEVLKAKHGVNESKARASLISAQARPQGGQ